MKTLHRSILVAAALSLAVACGRRERSAVVPDDGPGEIVKIGAILAVTGGASSLGAPEARTLELLVEQLNSSGELGGRQIKFFLKDSAGESEKAVSMAKQLIEEDKVVAIIGPSTSGESMAIKDICEEAGMLLVSCAAAEVIVNPVAKYVFKTPQKDSQAVTWIFNTMRDMGISRVGIVASNDGFGSAGKVQLESLAAASGIEILASELYDRDARDVSDVLTKLKARNVQAVINWSIVPAQSIVPKNMRQIGLNVPLFQSHGFGNISYVVQAGEAAEGILFPASRLLVAEQLPDDHIQKKLLTQYKREYEGRYNEPASAFGGYAHDALMLIVNAMKAADNYRDSSAVRDALEQTRGFVGVTGVYSFTPEDHNGLGLDAFEMLTVKNGQFTLAGK